jgi:F-type H+-transporting ATPase subunit delta
MRRSAAARRYARALFALAREVDRVEPVRRELDQIAALLAQSSELRRVLLTPLHPTAERKAVLHEIGRRVGQSGEVGHFLSFLIDQRRLVDFASIHEEYGRLADEASGRTTAKVIAASELGEERAERLRRALTRRTGREVQLDVEVDPSLLGGVIAKVGDLVFDGSLRSQLRQLRGNLSR